MHRERLRQVVRAEGDGGTHFINRFKLVIVDEAHAPGHLCNDNNLLWKTLYKYEQCDDHRLLLLTGTPVQNGIKDLGNMLRLLDPVLWSKDAVSSFVT